MTERLELVAENMREPVSAIVTGNPKLKQALASGLRGNGERSNMLTRFEDYAWWTIPALFPRETVTSGTDSLGFDLQSLGAQLTLNLVSKMMTSMFNPAVPFFKSGLSEEQYKLLMNDNQNTKEKVNQMMSQVEKNIITDFEANGGRAAAVQALTLTAVTGNALLHHIDDKYRVMSYRDYDAKFDAWGTMTDLVYREQISVGSLPKDIMLSVMNQGRETDDVVEIYTGCKLIEGKYFVWQEVEELMVIDDGFGIYDVEDLPYSAVRWSTSPGRDAGVGLVELTAGDWHMFSVLAETDIDLVALFTNILTLIDTQQGGIKVTDVRNAAVGGYVAGNKDALTSFSHAVEGKLADVDAKAQGVIRRLSQMFLMTGNVIRNSERTTAEEVRIVTQEIGQVHMPAYVALGEGLQKPIATLGLRKRIPELKIKPQVLAGITNITRAADLDARRGVWNDLVMLGNIPEHVSIYLKMEEEIKAVASGWGVDYVNTMRTQEEVVAEQKRNAELQAMQRQPLQQG